MKVAFLINPIAGYGFYSNLKDTVKAGDFDRAKSISMMAADIFLNGLDLAKISFTVPSGIMGEDLARAHHCSIRRTVKVSGAKEISVMFFSPIELYMKLMLTGSL